MHWGKLAALAALALILPNAYAAEAANEFGVAVIIGNKAYQDDRVPEVDYAHNDADAFYRFVVGTLGFSPDNVVDLRDATKARMESAFGSKGNVRGQLWRWAEADGSSDVVVFYSGHGVPGINDGRGYLLPVDANPDTAEINGYPIDVLYENLGKVPHKSVTVFLDACFSGGSGDGGKLIAGASPVYVEADVSGLPGLTVLTAATGKQLASWDTEARHGLFTEHLLEALYGAADADGNGRVSAAETKLYLDRHMTRAARRTYGREQDASLYGDERALLSFSSTDGWSSRPTLGPPPAAFTVAVEPAHARVRILNIGPPYQAGMELEAGSYQVEASAPGYVTRTEMVAHGATPTVHRLALSRPGQPFTIAPEPAQARVQLVGHPEAYRPGMLLPPGSYRVEASAEGYETATESGSAWRRADGAAHRAAQGRAAGGRAVPGLSRLSGDGGGSGGFVPDGLAGRTFERIASTRGGDRSAVRGGQVRGDVRRVGCLRAGRGLPTGRVHRGRPLWLGTRSASGDQRELGRRPTLCSVAVAEDGEAVSAAERVGVGVRGACGDADGVQLGRRDRRQPGQLPRVRQPMGR